MDPKSLEIVSLGFILPALFSITLVAEGAYKISKHEEGFFTFVLGTLFLVGLTLTYIFIINR